MEPRSDGVMECWSVGVLECWSDGESKWRVFRSYHPKTATTRTMRNGAKGDRRLHSILELSIKSRYDDAMPRLPSWIPVFPLTIGILTGCTTMVTTYDRIRATLSEPDYDDTIHRGGAWFLAPSNSSRVSTSRSLVLSLQRPEASGLPSSGRRIGGDVARQGNGAGRQIERTNNAAVESNYSTASIAFGATTRKPKNE